VLTDAHGSPVMGSIPLGASVKDGGFGGKGLRGGNGE